MATHSSTLAWKIPWMEEPAELQSMGSQSRTRLSDFTFTFFSAVCISWPKYWTFSISPSNEYSWLISFRTDWFDLLAVEGTLKSLQHNNLQASFLWHSTFFMVQHSHDYWNINILYIMCVYIYTHTHTH